MLEGELGLDLLAGDELVVAEVVVERQRLYPLLNIDKY